MPRLGTESVVVDAAVGRILRQSVAAERDQPPFDRVMMDGIAIARADFERGQRRFPIQATVHAGDAGESLDSGNCIEIMTGAALPVGADCIVPVERISVADGVAVIEQDYDAVPRRFVHARGSDHVEHTELLHAGLRITPMDVAIAASCGLAEVSVSRKPKIRIISTGNELVPAGQPIAPQQIRLSNGPAVIAMLGQHGFDDCRHEHVPDDPDRLRRHIGACLEAADVLVLSGGVSMGKADFVPQVLAELGVRRLFHKISQRPGKPMWFGLGPGGQPVFALPGNPVSTLVCCRQYVVPALNGASAARPGNPDFASLTADVTFEPDLTCFLPVRLACDATGRQLAVPVHTNTSGDFASLTGTAGYVELEREQSRFPSGSTVPLHRWRMA